jgi:methionyl aminopeptidase
VTTLELDEIGRKIMEEHGAQSAPQVTYDFPGATCISVNEEIAHGIPGARVFAEGDRRLVALCRDGKKAMWAGIRAVRAGAPLADIGDAIGKFASKGGYTLIRNLASHGVGDSLHDEPGEISTWPDKSERRRMTNGLVFTIEPFLSLGGRMADQKSADDEWTLIARPSAPCVQYEHTVVATPRGAVVVTLAA